MLTAHEGTSETSPESKAVPPPLEVEPTLETTQAPVEEVPLKEDHRQNVCFFNVLVGKLLVFGWQPILGGRTVGRCWRQSSFSRSYVF